MSCAEENRLKSNTKIKEGSILKFEVGFSCIAQYGGRIEIYDLVGEGNEQQIHEKIYDGNWLKKDYFVANNQATLTTKALIEPREITGFVLCLYNISGVILDQAKIDFNLKVGKKKKEWSPAFLIAVSLICIVYWIIKILKQWS